MPRLKSAFPFRVLPLLLMTVERLPPIEALSALIVRVASPPTVEASAGAGRVIKPVRNNNRRGLSGNPNGSVLSPDVVSAPPMLKVRLTGESIWPPLRLLMKRDDRLRGEISSRRNGNISARADMAGRVSRFIIILEERSETIQLNVAVTVRLRLPPLSICPFVF